MKNLGAVYNPKSRKIQDSNNVTIYCRKEGEIGQCFEVFNGVIWYGRFRTLSEAKQRAEIVPKCAGYIP